MYWIGLIESIPQRWKKEIKLFVLHSAEGYCPCSLRREPFLPNLTVKETYKTLIRPLVQQPTAQTFIERVLQRNDIDWVTVYLLPQKTTIESRMHIFGAKFRTIFCILIIGFINLVTQNLHCVHRIFTVTHLFCQCSKTIQLWSSLSNWCKESLTLPTLEPSTAILGFWDIKDEKRKLLNHVLTLFKYFIYANQ